MGPAYNLEIPPALVWRHPGGVKRQAGGLWREGEEEEEEGGE